jgi:FxsC-like protein
MTENPQGIVAPYFFLSYSHLAPTADSSQENPDHLVDRFFKDLATAVHDRASHASGTVAGFFDQRLPTGSDWKRVIIQRLNAAQVLVPLYTVAYLTNSWYGREFACFRQLMEVRQVNPVQRLAPVLWAPLAGVEEPPGLREALDSVAEPEYSENGLRHLLMHSWYRDLYESVLNRLATRIVDIAESNPVDPVAPSHLPDIRQVQSAFLPSAPLASFDIEIAAPTSATAPVGRSPGPYGETALLWRPFLGQELPLAEYARQIIERFDFNAEVSEAGIAKDTTLQRPGIIIIDAALAATESGQAALASLAGFPRWVLPLLVSSGEPDDPSGRQLASQARALLREDELPTKAARRGARGVESFKEFVSLVPELVAEAEQQYLRHRSGRVPSPRSVRPRLGESPGPDGTLLPQIREECVGEA